MRFLLVLIALILPTSPWAACGGVDVRNQFDGAQLNEIAQRLDGAPYPVGNHWTAAKDGLTIHIIGTMHIDDPRMGALADRLAPIIRSADVLLVEATTADQKALQNDVATNPDLAFLTGQTLIDLMPPEDWDALAAAATARGIPPFMAAKFQPWYLSLILSVSPCAMKVASKGNEGLDARLMRIAEAADVPTMSLEPYTTVFRLFSKDPIEEQIAMLSLGVLPDIVSENATATLKEQYFEEAHMAALETSRLITRPAVNLPKAEFDAIFDEFIDLLVRVRNESWIEPIEAAKGTNRVVAVGALHLGGKHGLLNLLDMRGYVLTRQAF